MNTTKSQFLKFAAGGAVGTAFHYATLVVLVEWFDWPVIAGTAAGFVVGAATNYFISRAFVFQTERAHTFALPRFLAVATVGALLNTAIVGFLFGAGLHYLLSQIVATGAVLVLNFFANKHWTFG